MVILKDDRLGQEGCKVRNGDRSQCLRFAGSIFKGPLTFEGPWPRQVSRCMSLVDLKDPRAEKKKERRTRWPDLPYFFLILLPPTFLLPHFSYELLSYVKTDSLFIYFPSSPSSIL